MKYIFCTDMTGHQRHTRPDGQCFLSAELPQVMRDGLEQTAHTLSQAERRHSLPGILLIMQYICLVIGMVCGGDVTVWFQYIPPENAAQIGVLRAWRDALGSGRNVWLCLVLDGETLREFRLLTADELRHGTEGFFTSRPYWDGSTFVEPIVRAGRVYLFGAGHVGRALAPVLHYIGFEVTVYDNRAELASPAHFPTAHEIIVGDFRRIFDKVSLTADDYAVVMTPGHQADYEILEQVLRTPATYIGCIGSRKKVALTRERLAAAGFSQQDIDRVHAPIGLPILAETPEEIAISVAAEMIRHRAEHL